MHAQKTPPYSHAALSYIYCFMFFILVHPLPHTYFKEYINEDETTSRLRVRLDEETEREGLREVLFIYFHGCGRERERERERERV